CAAARSNFTSPRLPPVSTGVSQALSSSDSTGNVGDYIIQGINGKTAIQESSSGPNTVATKVQEAPSASNVNDTGLQSVTTSQADFSVVPAWSGDSQESFTTFYSKYNDTWNDSGEQTITITSTILKKPSYTGYRGPSVGSGSAFAQSCNSASQVWSAVYASLTTVITTTVTTTYTWVTSYPPGPHSTFTLCDHYPRAQGSPNVTRTVAPATITTAMTITTVSANPAQPPPACSIDSADCEQLWSSYMLDAVFVEDALPITGALQMSIWGSPEKYSYWQIGGGDIQGPRTPACPSSDLTTLSSTCNPTAQYYLGDAASEWSCLIYSGPVRLMYFPPDDDFGDFCYANGTRSTETNATVANGNALEPSKITTFGTTFTSGTAYLSFETLYAKDRCGKTIGTPVSNYFFPVQSSEVSTDCGGILPSNENKTFAAVEQPVGPINYHYLTGPVPASAYKCMANCNGGLPGWEKLCPTIWDNYNPVLAFPTPLLTAQSEWPGNNCYFDTFSLFQLEGGGNLLFDPPYLLTPHSAPAGPTSITNPLNPSHLPTPGSGLQSGHAKTTPPPVPPPPPAPEPQPQKTRATPAPTPPANTPAAHSPNPPQYPGDPSNGNPQDPHESARPAGDPDSSGGDSGSSGGDPGSSGRDPGSSGGDLGSSGGSRGSGGGDPGSSGGDPGSNGGNPGSNGRDPGSNGEDPGSSGGEPSGSLAGDPGNGGDSSGGSSNSGNGASPGQNPNPAPAQSIDPSGAGGSIASIIAQPPPPFAGQSDSDSAAGDPNEPGQIPQNSGAPASGSSGTSDTSGNGGQGNGGQGFSNPSSPENGAGPGANPAPYVPIATVGGQTISAGSDPSASGVVVGGHTLSPGESTVIAGTPLSVAGSSLVIGTAAIIPYASAAAHPGAPVTTVAGVPVLTAAGGSGYLIGSKTIAPGSATVVDGASVSVDGDGNLVIGPASMIPLPTESASMPSLDLLMSGVMGAASMVASEPAAIFTLGGETYTARQGEDIVLPGGKTLAAGGPAVTLTDGEVVSMGRDGVVLDGTSTVTFPGAGVESVSDAVITMGGHVYTAIKEDGEVALDGVTMKTGEVRTIDGEVVSWGSGGLVVDGSSIYMMPMTSSTDPSETARAGAFSSATAGVETGNGNASTTHTGGISSAFFGSGTGHCVRIWHGWRWVVSAFIGFWIFL
ncbi:MAG: hypothetical protein M1820_003598, partial [Bogoriella megaspora]